MNISRGKIIGAQKIVVYGPEGIGKSTFASQFPTPIFIDTEGSTKHMDVARLPKPSSWSMLLSEVQEIKSEPGICGTLVLDTADWAEQLCVTHVCDKAKKSGIEDFGYGKGYVYVMEEFGRLLNLLGENVELGVNVVVTAHAKMRKFEQPEEMGAYDRWELKLGDKTRALVKEWADMVLFANYKTFTVKSESNKIKAQGGSRVMYTTHHPCWDAKNRHGLDEELPFSFSEIAHCLTNRPDSPPVVREPTCTAPLSESLKKHQTQQSESPAPPVSPPGIPKALADLMAASSVTEAEIQQAVSDKGYYPIDTPMENYDPQFVAGVLVGAWGQVLKLIEDGRDLPF